MTWDQATDLARVMTRSLSGINFKSTNITDKSEKYQKCLQRFDSVRTDWIKCWQWKTTDIFLPKRVLDFEKKDFSPMIVRDESYIHVKNALIKKKTVRDKMEQIKINRQIATFVLTKNYVTVKVNKIIIISMKQSLTCKNIEKKKR